MTEIPEHSADGCAIVRTVSRTIKEPPLRGAAPSVSFREEVAGRDTLAAIAASRAEALYPPHPREPSTTKHYGDRISNAPGALSPRVARALDGAPEVTFKMGFAGRDTQVVLEQDRRSAPPEIEITSGEVPLPEVDVKALEIEQIYSFVVRASVDQLENAADKRRLIEQRLLQRMPGCKLSDITDIQVKTRGPNTLSVRISARVT